MRQDKESQFEQLFRNNYAIMYRMAYTMLHDEEESKDIVSEVFTRLWNGTITLKTDTEKGYLLICVRNSCLNLISHKKLDEKLRRLYPIDQSVSILPVDKDEQLWKEMNAFIETELTPQTRLILRLCYDEEKSYKEVAEILNVSLSAVNKHIVKALRKLRERFNP